METHIDEISSEEAIKLVKTFGAGADQSKISSANLASLLMVPEDQIVAKVNELRAPTPKRTFVDRSGILSAAIAFSLLIGFSVAKTLYEHASPSAIGSPRIIRTGPLPTTWTSEVEVVPDSSTSTLHPPTASSPSTSSSSSSDN